MTDKEHTVLCHGCGKFHTVKYSFASGMSIWSDNGKEYLARGCPDCMESQHEIIKKVYEGKLRAIRLGY